MAAPGNPVHIFFRLSCAILFEFLFTEVFYRLTLPGSKIKCMTLENHRMLSVGADLLPDIRLSVVLLATCYSPITYSSFHTTHLYYTTKAAVVI